MEENKVLGLETAKYTKICYMLVLIASGFGVLANLLILVGVSIPGAVIIGLLGLVGMAMAATGWVVFKDKFSVVDISHFKFLVILFAAFFIFGIVFAPLLINAGIIGTFLLILLAIFQFALLFTGFTLWGAGEEATKDSLINGFKNLPSTFNK